MSTNHTPGIWHAVKYPDVKTWTVTARESVASKIKTEADARLIAAAPGLLEVCKQTLMFARRQGNCICSRDHGTGHDEDCPVPALEAAIDLAELPPDDEILDAEPVE